MNISTEEYKEITRNRKPEVSYYGSTSWYEDYYIQGNLMRFTGFNNSESVEYIDLWGEDMSYMAEGSE